MSETKQQSVSADADATVGRRLRILRERCGLSMRQLGNLAGVTASMISCIERDLSSPSIATLQKLLTALGSDLPSFFGPNSLEEDGPVFPREHMRLVSDADRSYTIVFPRREGVEVELLDEEIRPAQQRPPFETLTCDVAGYVLSGHLVLECGDDALQTLRPGDAFYIPKGTRHRGYATDDIPTRLVTVYSPARY